MAQTLTSKTVEFASGVTGAMPFNVESATSYNYPLVQSVPGDLGGLSVYTFVAAASTNLTSIKTTPGMVYGYTMFSINTDIVYLAFYDKASAPVAGTDTIKLIDGVLDSSTTTGQRTSMYFSHGVTFSTGIACAVFETMPTGTASNLDTAPTVLVNIFYK